MMHWSQFGDGNRKDVDPHKPHIFQGMIFLPDTCTWCVRRKNDPIHTDQVTSQQPLALAPHDFIGATLTPLRCHICGGHKHAPQHRAVVDLNRPLPSFTPEDERFLRAIESMPFHLTRRKSE